MSERLTPDELRTLFLFESLDEDKLAWLAERGVTESHASGETVYGEGEDATCFYVLLSGTLALVRLMQGNELELNRTDQRGAYSGAMQAYMGDRVDQRYTSSLRAISDCTFWVLPAAEFAAAVRDWFPMSVHLLEGFFLGMKNMTSVVGDRERLLALGSLSAGLTHELNNPAAAAVRATAALRERVAGMRHKLAMLAEGRLDQAQLHVLVAFQEAAAERVGKAPNLTALEASDAEDELGDWLDEHRVRGGWDLAPPLVAGGIDVPWLDGLTDAVTPENLEPAIRWLGYTVETEALMSEIEDAVARISTLLAAAKQYSQMDRAPFQDVDVHELLDSTLVMLSGKTHGVDVVKDYDRSLPKIPAYAAELNQVWTNIIDNALHAMAGAGTLTVRTFAQGDFAVVEITDTGPGIPDDVRNRIFEPFFTTKPVGEGTGLGLDIAYRIVVKKHTGNIVVDSRPGDTRFRVLLPLDGPQPA